MTKGHFEQGPIRPPSEAYSLLLRVTRNCPWNRCEFCHTYRGEQFSLRSVEEIKKDIDAVREVVSEIKSLSWSKGFGGEIAAPLADLRACWDQVPEVEHFDLAPGEGEYVRCCLTARAGVDLRLDRFERRFGLIEA